MIVKKLLTSVWFDTSVRMARLVALMALIPPHSSLNISSTPLTRKKEKQMKRGNNFYNSKVSVLIFSKTLSFFACKFVGFPSRDACNSKRREIGRTSVKILHIGSLFNVRELSHSDTCLHIKISRKTRLVRWKLLKSTSSQDILNVFLMR